MDFQQQWSLGNIDVNSPFIPLTLDFFCYGFYRESPLAEMTFFAFDHSCEIMNLSVDPSTVKAKQPPY